MSFHHLDQYAHIDSPVSRRSPTVRVLGAVVIALGAALLPTGAWPQMAALGILVITLAAMARVPLGTLATRMAAPFVFVLLVAGAVLVVAPGTPLVEVGPVTITDTGLARFGSVAARAAVALGAAIILVSTTPFDDLVRALRALRLPEAVTTSLGLAYRFLYILNDEVERMRRAARSRGAAEGATPRRRLMVGIASAALRRSFDRSERLHRAMLARGFSGELPALRPHTAHGRPILEIVLLSALVSAIAGSTLL